MNDDEICKVADPNTSLHLGFACKRLSNTDYPGTGLMMYTLQVSLYEYVFMRIEKTASLMNYWLYRGQLIDNFGMKNELGESAESSLKVPKWPRLGSPFLRLTDNGCSNY